MNKTKTVKIHNIFTVLVLFFVYLIRPSIANDKNKLQSVPNRIMLAPVVGDVEYGLSFFIQRMIRKAERENVSALILEINSNGGLVQAAQEMKDALLRSKVLTVAYIRGRALSAAALIAISCHKIFMEQGTELGAATPVMLGGSGVKAAEEKVVSAFRAEFESTAEARGRPKKIAAAMVDKNHDEIPGISKRGEVLTLTAEVALTSGYCDGIVSDVQSVIKKLGFNNYTLETLKPTSAEWIARWLTNPNISVILFSIGSWFLFIELVTPGFGLLGWTGILFLALFFGGHLFAYLAGFEALILFSIGIILLLLEFFVIPGFGLAGIFGILLTCLSVIMVFGGIYDALNAIAKMIVISVFFIVALYKLGPKFKLFDELILKESLSTEAGFVAVDLDKYKDLLNLEGITVSPLRPSGIVKIGDQRYEVVSDGEYIERNQRVVVIAVEGTKIVVRQLKS